jgi:two-component sensor histidine kinase
VNLVSSIDSTWLVFSQPTGIYLMDLKKFNHEGKLEFTLFNQRNGFLGLEPGQNGALKDSKGNIWMTTGTEVVKLNPKALEFKKDSVTIRISAFNGKPLPFSLNQIKLPRNEKTAIVQFETICFNQPKMAEYSWRIGDGEWTSWQKEDYAVLTELSDGKLNLEVRSKIPGLPNSETLTSIKLFVSVAFWKQAWFFPTLLTFVSLLVILAILLLIQTRTKMLQINKQAKTFQLQAILSQMNPHFIFNVMAALQSMILSANIEKANDYLVRMSNLVRGFLEASISTSSAKSKKLKNGEMPLIKELEILQTFIEFQQLIYPDKFDYRLVIDHQIDPDKISIPPMLIQPFVENAIRHGLLQKEKDGLLQIKIDLEESNQLSIIISDNGIGIQKAGEIIGKSPLLYTSRGKELTEKRIKLLNEMGYRIIYQTISSDQGTTVTLKIGKHES